MINEPTYILESSSSCIDLVLTSQPNLITESGVHPSLHPNYHHQIIAQSSSWCKNDITTTEGKAIENIS